MNAEPFETFGQTEVSRLIDCKEGSDQPGLFHLATAGPSRAMLRGSKVADC